MFVYGIGYKINKNGVEDIFCFWFGWYVICFIRSGVGYIVLIEIIDFLLVVKYLINENRVNIIRNNKNRVLEK